MSSALAKAAPLKAEIRLAEAVSLFEADLSTDQKVTFRNYRSQSYKSPPDTQDVMRLTAEVDRRTSGKLGGGRCFGPRLTNILQSVQQFAALGDIIVGGSQNLIACGVWSLVRMTLLSIVNFSSCLEKLSTLLMIVGRSAPRYQRMALLYPRSKILQSHLSEYFIVVVRLCHQLLKLTKKPILGRLVSFLSDSDMNNYQSELDRWASSIREEVNLLIGQNIEEQSSHFKALLRFSDSESHRQRLKVHIRVLDSCSTYDYQTTWKEIRKVGNATLFNQTPEYRDWKARANSCTLMCTGKLGSGKSVLLANIVDDLNLHVQSAQHPVAYFFCRYDISKSLNARTIIGSLARQLLHPIPGLTMVEELVDRTTLVLDSERILCVLQRALPPDFKAYFVLDGLDECSDNQRRILIQQLRRLQDIFTLLICVSFRLEADNVMRLSPEQFAEQRTIAIPDDNPDIGGFISAELERCIESGKLTIGNPTLILEIEDALLRGAQGMFLWVALQIESLRTAKTDEAIRQALADLPKDLPETFSRILRRSGELGKHHQTRIFELVTVARRPLTTEELREALSVVPGDTVWNPVRLLNDVYSALACCGSLITVDEEEPTVRLVHQSVKQFFFGEFKGSIGAMSTIEAANRTMGEVIVTYLNYGVFETQLSTMMVPQILTEEAPSRIVRSIDTSSSIRSLALKLLQTRRQPNFNIGKVLADASEHFKSTSLDQFQFYSYAKSYWLQHAWCISKHEPLIYSLLLKVLKVLKREIVDMDTKDDESGMLLLWAAENGNVAVVKLLLEKGANIDSSDKSGSTPLLRAAENGHEAVVKLLLEKGANIELTDKDGQTPLSWAAANGHEAVVKLLLEKGANIELTDKDGQTPLSGAAANGHEAVVKLLLEKGANIELTDKDGQTPLSGAAANGHEAVVKLLLEKGANIELTDKDGQTPLSGAAANGHEAVVKLLLEKGANIELTDKDGQTPLSGAAANGHEAVVKLLLEKGANIELTDKDGQTPLSGAAANGHEAVVKLLLEKGANIELTDKDGQTPLSWAAANGHEAVVKLLLATGKVDVDSKDTKYGRTPLSRAAASGHEAVVKLLLATGKVNVDSKDSYYGRTPLSRAAESGHEAVVKLLLATGKVDVDSKDSYNQTPLSRAAEGGHEGGHEAVVKLLLATGKVDVDSKDSYNRTPLSRAAEGGHEAVVKLLLATGKVDVDSKDTSYGQTPLSRAAESGHEAVVKLLLATGKVDVDSKDNNSGQTPLSRAAESGHEAVVKLLLATGKVDVDSKDTSYGRTPLSRAAESGHEAVVKLLLATGKVDVDSKDNNSGQTPLSRAAESGHEAVVKLLLATGKVDVDSKDSYDQTPLSGAAESGHEAVVKLLLATGKVDVDSKDSYYGQTPLSSAAENGHEAVVKLLLATGKVDVDSKDSYYGQTPLSSAAENGHEAVVKLLLATGKVDVDSKDSYGRTPLWGAAENGHEAVLKLLLATGKVDVDSKDSYNGRTPLSRAAESGHEAVVKLLKSHGARFS